MGNIGVSKRDKERNFFMVMLEGVGIMIFIQKFWKVIFQMGGGWVGDIFLRK